MKIFLQKANFALKFANNILLRKSVFQNPKNQIPFKNTHRFFSTNDKNDNKSNDNKEPKKDGEKTKLDEIIEEALKDEQDIKQNKVPAKKLKLEIINKKLIKDIETIVSNETEKLISPDEEKTINEFIKTIDPQEEIKDEEEPKEKTEQNSLLYYPSRILPYSKYTIVSNKHDTFFNLIMKYGKPIQQDEDTVVIDNLTLYADKDDPSSKSLSSVIYGTECKITYENREKIIIEGLDKVYKFTKSNKLGKHRLFNPKEQQQVNIVFVNNKEYLDKSILLLENIISNHNYIVNNLDIDKNALCDNESFIFNLDYITNYLGDVKENTEEGFLEISKFVYYFIAKANYFSNIIYSSNLEIGKFMVLKDINMKLEKLEEHFENLKKLLVLKYEHYNFIKNFKFNIENPFDTTAPEDVKRILKYKDTVDSKYEDSSEKIKNEYLKKLNSIQNMSEETREALLKEINKLTGGISIEMEKSKIIEYLNHVFNLPWDNHDDPKWDLNYAKNILDTNLYGLHETKERIYEFIAKNLRKKNKKGCVILLTGGPGTGKTRIAKLIGDALQRKTGFISMGGQRDGKSVLGFKRTYVGSTPGIFTKEMQKVGVNNPVIVIDEIDKVGSHGQFYNVYYSLLQLLNIEENHRFTDHYLDIPFDYSNVIFILTSNKMDIFPPLLDRMEVINVDPYATYEKFLILKKFSKEQLLKDYEIKDMEITDKALYKLIYDYCNKEGGVRKAKQLLESMIRKVVSKLELSNYENNNEEIQINSQNLMRIMSDPKDEDVVLKDIMSSVHTKVGNCIGLYVSKTDQSNSWGNASLFSLEVRNSKKFKETESDIKTADITEISHTDVKIIGKKGKAKPEDIKIKVTGNLGEDSTQSLSIAINVAINVLGTVAPEKQDFFYKNQLHYNAPEIHLAKSGPSAGVVNFLCAMSLALDKPLIENLALTGEVAIDGTVLNIGGVREKSNGASKVGVTTLVLPYGNRFDFLELPDYLKNSFKQIFFAQNCEQVYRIGFGLNTSDIPQYSSQQREEKITFDEQILEHNLINKLF
jgi:endopeptidase La